jgi:hypothetical protein
MERDIKHYKILKRSWKTRLVDIDRDYLDDQVAIAALMNEIDQDPQVERWAQLKQIMSTFLIPLIIRSDGNLSIYSIIFIPNNWKTFNGKAIPFPERKELEYVKLVCQIIPR